MRYNAIVFGVFDNDHIVSTFYNNKRYTKVIIYTSHLFVCAVTTFTRRYQYKLSICRMGTLNTH